MDNNTKFNTYLGALGEYISREGNSKVPAIHIEKYKENEISLGAWVGYIRQRYRKNLLPLDRVKKMEEINHWQWGPFQPGPATDDERNIQIYSMRSSGASLREIADEFDLSRQRVHQIIKRSQAGSSTTVN
jgi:Mor family transcriptional regulator